MATSAGCSGPSDLLVQRRRPLWMRQVAIVTSELVEVQWRVDLACERK